MKINNFWLSSLFTIIIVVGLIGAFVIIFLSTQKNSLENLENKETERGFLSDQKCVSQIEEQTVQGDSLSGLIEPGETVKILFGYYHCNEIKKEEIVVYDYAGSESPLIKIIKGIPGDKFQLKKSQSGCWNILINGEVIKNSQNLPYCIDEAGYRMLSLYERDYGGVIPPDAYLILSNLISGAMDSTRFGLVGREDIIGKVIK